MRYPNAKLGRFPPKRPNKSALRLGFAGAVLLRWFGRRSSCVTTDDLGRHEYATSTQRIGIRFTDRIRDTFRFRWIRRAS